MADICQFSWSLLCVLCVVGFSDGARSRAKAAKSQELKLISYFTNSTSRNWVQNKFVRPSRAYDEPVVVKISFSLINILDIEWIDYRIMWLPSEHDSINKLLLPAKEVWVPDITIKNSLDSSTRLCRGLVIFSSDGGAFCSSKLSATVTCQMTMKHFPFDRHKCKAVFGSATYDGSQLSLVNRTNLIEVDGMYENVEWLYVNGSITKATEYFSGRNYPEVRFEYELERWSPARILMMVVPSCIMSLMVPLVLVAVPGEKTALGIGLEVGFLFLLIANLPQSAGPVNEIPYLVLYYIINFLLVAAALVTSQIIVACANKPAEFAVNPELKKYVHSRDIGRLVSWILFGIFMLSSVTMTCLLFYALVAKVP
ncbi:neuronal acetylcholine receptor subunit beta-2-like isoform X2 [Tubulanus polymorphus]|uniref:neuronal acetylcholine receptor subunit beta-2-like isoform X2 n=1 Tax=Tubulanus polymorphus TaxID=672921 RepID=UPI003DA2200C